MNDFKNMAESEILLCQNLKKAIEHFNFIRKNVGLREANWFYEREIMTKVDKATRQEIKLSQMFQAEYEGEKRNGLVLNAPPDAYLKHLVKNQVILTPEERAREEKESLERALKANEEARKRDEEIARLKANKKDNRVNIKNVCNDLLIKLKDNLFAHYERIFLNDLSRKRKVTRKQLALLLKIATSVNYEIKGEFEMRLSSKEKLDALIKKTAFCQECGENGSLMQDLEDGLMKHYSCCDMPNKGYF